jgi:hypothetical protein
MSSRVSIVRSRGSEFAHGVKQRPPSDDFGSA